jgi:hypothetical protein
MIFFIFRMTCVIRADLSELGFPINSPNGLRSRSMALGRAWTLLASRKNPKPRMREMLAVGAAESPASSAPKKIASDHFIRENIALFRQDAQKSGGFLKIRRIFLGF